MESNLADTRDRVFEQPQDGNVWISKSEVDPDEPLDLLSYEILAVTRQRASYGVRRTWAMVNRSRRERGQRPGPGLRPGSRTSS
jgi:hypothetical protein